MERPSHHEPPSPERATENPFYIQPEDPFWEDNGLELAFTKRLQDHGRVKRQPNDDGNFDFLQTPAGTDTEKGWGFGAIANAESRFTNLDQLTGDLGLDFDGVVFPERVSHGAEIVRVETVMAGEALPTCDALLTSNPEITLVMWAADCSMAYVYDETTSARSLIHMSILTLPADVVADTMQQMAEAYGTNPADCHVWIGPGVNDLEIGADGTPFAERFNDWATGGIAHQETPLDISPLMRPGEVVDGQQRHQLDVQKICEAEFLAIGVSPNNLETTAIDTMRAIDPDTGRMMFPSYRRDGAGLPNAAAIFGVRSGEIE